MTDVSDIPALLKTLDEMQAKLEPHRQTCTRRVAISDLAAYQQAATNAIPALAAAIRERDAEIERLVAVNAKICDFNREHSAGEDRKMRTKAMDTIPPPTTEANLARDPASDYDPQTYLAMDGSRYPAWSSALGNAWIRRAVAAEADVVRLRARNEILNRDALKWAERLEAATAECSRWQAVMKRTNADLAELVAEIYRPCQTRLEHPVQGVGADEVIEGDAN